MTSTAWYIDIGNVEAGNGAIGLSGTTVETGQMTTTGNVSLTSSQGYIYSTINDAASINASASYIYGSSIYLYSTSTTNPLNATSVIASATYPGSGAYISLRPERRQRRYRHLPMPWCRKIFSLLAPPTLRIS